MSKAAWAASVGLLLTLSAPSQGQVYDRIAFQSSRDSEYDTWEALVNWEIYSMNTDGSDQINLTNRQAKDIDPAW